MNDSPPLKPTEAEAVAKKSKVISVNRAWLLEVIGVIGIKRVAEKNNWPNNIMMIAAFFLSFKCLSELCRRYRCRPLILYGQVSVRRFGIGRDADIPGIEAPISPVMHVRDHWLRGRLEAA